MDVLSLLPTHVATRRVSVYPIVQLSLRLLVVPVLTDTVFPRTFRMDDGPKARVLDPLSDRI